MPDRAIVWLRRDLRLTDHAALAFATQHCREVCLAFVYDANILDRLPNRQDRRVQFIHQSLEEIFRKTGALVTLVGDPVELIPALAQDLGADWVVAAHDDDPYAVSRDSRIREVLGERFQTVLDHLVREKQQVVKDDGTPYRVYSPYRRAWQASVVSQDFAPKDPDLSRLKRPARVNVGQVGNPTLEQIGFQGCGRLVVEPGEDAARGQLAQFAAKLPNYKIDRDTPSRLGTSGLSTALRFGTVSIRECLRIARADGSPGAETWENELIWREFYHMILANFPEVGAGRAFNPQYQGLEWPGDPGSFDLWKAGQTGYPLVDAAMRCFAATGWMHNRLRMVTAMFLTKDLLLDWRLGEAYFADNLLDFDLASNNGGWQWSAGTGADAQPYFRIFNPVLQSRKFDPEGEFIREWVPELRGLDSESVHWPFSPDGTRNLVTPPGYPDPLVDHAVQKSKAIALFQTEF
ncbi:MAG: deoxyribodipyrimidine photo-lyase [Armatimonadetes bacterium]|nr:deoxyribodipyrimidine photo-lyase [Armatimonadota bacterium]MBX3108319.1 deoxyribodipyrimidine photo-lyase [Fimbriimonadaceae bacterium]